MDPCVKVVTPNRMRLWNPFASCVSGFLTIGHPHDLHLCGSSVNAGEVPPSVAASATLGVAQQGAWDVLKNKDKRAAYDASMDAQWVVLVIAKSS